MSQRTVQKQQQRNYTGPSSLITMVINKNRDNQSGSGMDQSSRRVKKKSAAMVFKNTSCISIKVRHQLTSQYDKV